MHNSDIDSFILEQYLGIDTVSPECWLAALRVLSDSPRLSRKIVPDSPAKGFRARLSTLRSENAVIHAGYTRNSSQIYGSNTGSAAIIMTVEGSIDLVVNNQNRLCGPWHPVILDPDEDFQATLSSETHTLVIQLKDLDRKIRDSVTGKGLSYISRCIEHFLLQSPFFLDHQHALLEARSFRDRLYRYLLRGHITPLPAHENVLADRRLRNVIAHIDDNLRSEIDFGQLANQSGLSLRNLHYLIKKHIGQTPNQYLKKRRLIKVREAIIKNHSEKTKISEHARDWGFNHPGRFSSAYFNLFGEYPKETIKHLDHLSLYANDIKRIPNRDTTEQQSWLTSLEP